MKWVRIYRTTLRFTRKRMLERGNVYGSRWFSWPLDRFASRTEKRLRKSYVSRPAQPFRPIPLIAPQTTGQTVGKFKELTLVFILLSFGGTFSLAFQPMSSTLSIPLRNKQKNLLWCERRQFCTGSRTKNTQPVTNATITTKMRRNLQFCRHPQRVVIIRDSISHHLHSVLVATNAGFIKPTESAILQCAEYIYTTTLLRESID